MSAAAQEKPQDNAALLALVKDAQHKLTQLEATAKGLIDELASGAQQATPRLRELLTTGEQLVAVVQAASAELAPRLPAGGAQPAAPNRAAVEAVWSRELYSEQQLSAPIATPASHPAGSLHELADNLKALPGCRLELLRGRHPAAHPGEAAAVLLHCGRAFVAVVHLQRPGGVEPLCVGVLSTAEARAALAAADSSSAGGGSLWAPSKHAVFQQLAAQAAGALEHFLQQQGQQAPAASPLELLLLWLATNNDLFSKSSSDGNGGGGLLPADAAAAVGGGVALPLRRPCQLGWEQLWSAAFNPHLRRAEPATEAMA